MLSKKCCHLLGKKNDFLELLKLLWIHSQLEKSTTRKHGHFQAHD